MKFSKKSVAVLAVVTIGLIVFMFFHEKTPPIINGNQIKTVALIDYPSEFNYRQSTNDCGPFSTAAVVRALNGEEVDSQVFTEEIGWRLSNGYTLPWGLEKQIEKSGIIVEKPNLAPLSYDEKILFLQEQLSQKKPAIILGEIDGFEHYITIFGFDALKDEFYIYDSLYDKNPDSAELTKDNNANLPGNRTLSSQELLDFWRGGGMYGIYEWYGVVASMTTF
ncbi:MAG: hypothetical protein WC846_01465 [Candidatus Gracilibacteria bacterium]|jgi:hypothetical protein